MMRLYSVAEFERHWSELRYKKNIAVCGSVISLKNELFLIEEGFDNKSYKNNKRLHVNYPGARYELRNKLLAIGGGPSPFWEAAIVMIHKSEKMETNIEVYPSFILYRSHLDDSFVKLHVDEISRQKEIEFDEKNRMMSSDLKSSGELDPFSSAGEFMADYWKDKI